MFTSEALITADGRRVAILSPGTPNRDGGPDFLDALIRVGGTTFAGDVELHTNAASWKSHKHENDPHYNRVILHVVMTADTGFPPAQTASRRPVPLLVLHPVLDAQLYARWATAEETAEGPHPSLRCFPFNFNLSGECITRWIEHLGGERIELKIRRYEERLKQLTDEHRTLLRESYSRYYGNPDDIPRPYQEYSQKDFSSAELWDQLLYEGIMEGMGYSKNREPFLALARQMRLDRLRRHNLSDTPTIMALLFGAAGLLPSAKQIQEKESRQYIKGLRQRWKGLHPLHRIPLLHEGDWLFFRLRPGNFPTGRLAAICYLLPRLFGDSAIRRVVSPFKEPDPSSEAIMHTLRRIFQIEPDAFWRTHYHFRGRGGKRGISIGPDRIADLIINAVVPVVLLYARIFRDQEIRSRAFNLIEHLSPPQSNSILRLMERELTRGKLMFDSVLRQQGGIRLYGTYCAEGRCEECALGQTIGAPLTSSAASS